MLDKKKNYIKSSFDDTKLDIISIMDEEKDVLDAIMAVHESGSKKYVPYNWYNDPANADGDKSANLNAIIRHYLAHKMGFPVDGDNLYHLEHIICRAAMLVANTYRDVQDKISGGFVPREAYYRYITPQVLYSLAKTRNWVCFKLPVEALGQTLMSAVYMCHARTTAYTPLELTSPSIVLPEDRVLRLAANLYHGTEI